MKKRFLVRVVLFVIFALFIGVALMSENVDKSQKQDGTITDNYYNNFFGLADGIVEVKDALKKKFNEFIDFVEIKH